MRLKRSPLAPKKTILQGLAICSAGNPSRSGLLAAPAPVGCAAVTVFSSGMIPLRTDGERLIDRRDQRAQRRFDRALKMNAYPAAIAFVKRHPIAQGLRREQCTEADVHAGDDRVVGIIGGDLQNDAG